MQYHIGRNGQQLGPFDEHQIQARLASGELSATDLAWREGMTNWEPVGQMFNNPYQPSAALGESPLFDKQVYSLRLASRGARLGAVILNSLFSFLAAIPMLVGWVVLADTSGSFAQVAVLGLGLIWLGFLIYQLMLMVKTGQSLGKKILGIRVVRSDTEGNPGFVRIVLIREVLLIVIGAVPFLGFFFSIADPCCIFREDRRCIHDLMANTKVVEV